MLNPFSAGQDLTAAALNAAFDIVRPVVQGADSPPVNNSTSLVASTYLTLPVVASASYLAEMELIYDTAAAADFQSSLVIPSGTGILSRWTSGAAGTAIDSVIEHNANTSLIMISGGVAVGTFMSCRRSGMLVIGGSSGNATIFFAQVTANVSNTVLKQGSWLRLTRVA